VHRPGPALTGGLLAALTLLLIGWSSLLVPSLIRSIESSFDKSDADIGLVYLLSAVAYAVGSFGGGPATERLGRRLVLTAAALTHGLGLLGEGLAPGWSWFVAGAVFAGLGAGALDGGSNGVVLDLYRTGRGRAMNLLHLSFSAGALLAPLVVGQVVGSGVPWSAMLVATGLLVVPLAIGYAVVPLPSGRRIRPPSADTATLGEPKRERGRPLLAGPLLLLAIAIGCYVAAEIGVSNWLVRFLAPAELQTATLALSLYWAGLTVGRLVSSAIADRFDHLRYTIASAVCMAGALAFAIGAPGLPASIAGFALAGLASGPIFPMIVAIGGERYPARSAAVGGTLTGVAVVGSTIYPPAMGFLSVTVGLTAAMGGTVVLAALSALALVAFGRAVQAGGGDDRGAETGVAPAG
jgi:MFS transporter, FHS family, glucose/mannose:H+ symporter